MIFSSFPRKYEEVPRKYGEKIKIFRNGGGERMIISGNIYTPAQILFYLNLKQYSDVMTP